MNSAIRVLFRGATAAGVPVLRDAGQAVFRIGYTPQVPVHRVVERDAAKIAAWRTWTWAKVRG